MADGKRIGRPSIFSTALADAILWRVADGQEITAIAKQPDMPAFSTIYAWTEQHAEFGQAFARARSIAGHFLAQQALEIADDDSNDLTPDGQPNHPAIGRARIKVEQRRWLAGKYNPMYLDKQVHTGPDGLSPIQVQHTYRLDNLTPDELAEFQRLLRKCRAPLLEG
jgi:hypothetical protein